MKIITGIADAASVVVALMLSIRSAVACIHSYDRISEWSHYGVVLAIKSTKTTDGNSLQFRDRSRRHAPQLVAPS
jgi:hypothetical protein